MSMNRLANCRNRFQGPALRVLCVCSAGLLRSPTCATLLARDPWNFNTRSAGCVPEYALIPVDGVLCDWADVIVVMEPWQGVEITGEFPSHAHKLVILEIPDQFPRMSEELQRVMLEQLEAVDWTLYRRAEG